MPGNKVFLDTNIVIEVFAGNLEIADKIKELDGFFISSIVLGELYIGVNRVANRLKHHENLLSFLDLCDVINIDSDTSQYFGEITATLYKKGKPHSF